MIEHYNLNYDKILLMLNKLIALKENLEKNWTFVHKILFSLSVFLLFRALVRVSSIDTMRVYSLVFVLIGFYVYTIDKWVEPLVDFFKFISKKDIDDNAKNSAILVVAFMLITILSVVLYYVTGFYPYIAVFIFSAIQSVLFTAIFKKYKPEKKGRLLKIVLLAMTLLGIAGMIYSFYYHSGLNVILFIYIVAFFMVDALIGYWQKHYAYE